MFAIKRDGLNLPRGIGLGAITLVLLVVLTLLGQEKYLVSVMFGLLFAGLSDPGGPYGHRALFTCVMGLVGALLSALGFIIGTGPWGFAVLAAFVLTALAGLTVKYGMHRFAAAMLLNVWFFVMLALPANIPPARSSPSPGHTDWPG